MPFFSIIIPVYNLESYILDTLTSIEAQTCSDYEAIIVDDGSTDGSAEVCKEWCEHHPRFSLFKKENGGVSSARNLGLSVIKGEYVLFVDGDDLISHDLLETLNLFLSRGDIDIVNYAHRKVPLNCNFLNKEGGNCLDGFVYEFDITKDVKGFLTSGARGPFYSACFSVYKTSIIREHHILFPIEVKSGEDSTFSHIYALFTRKGVFLKKYVGYYYRTNPESCIQSHQSDFFFFLSQELKSREYIYNYLKNEKLWSQGTSLLQQLCWETMVHLAEYYPKLNSTQLLVIMNNGIWHDVILPTVIKYSPLGYRRFLAKLSCSRFGMRMFVFLLRSVWRMQGRL